MSLNWREIDLILSEIPLQGALVQQVHQPSHPTVVLELYNSGRPFRLLFCFANRVTRLHLLTRRMPGGGKPQRFVSFLRAHVRGGRVLSAGQLGSERIVWIEVQRGEERVILWARLWGGAGNLIVTDPGGSVLDALYRRPRRGEVSGGRYDPTAQTAASLPEARLERYRVRELPGEGSFSERVERHYAAVEEEQERQRLEAALRGRYARQENRLQASLEGLRRRLEESGGHAWLQKLGRLILSNLHRLQKGDRWLEAEDYERPGTTVRIELDPQLSPADNAARYFRRQRRSRSTEENLRRQVARQEEELRRLRALAQRLDARPDLAWLRSQAGGAERRRKTERETPGPGLEFSSAGFRILVGRTASENDELLRRRVRGNDTWLHARDVPGAYVFIRARPGKSVPLEVLLDAANLALHYSRGRSSGGGDLYYTQVKHLRRARGAKTGLVIPTQEKNLHVQLDPRRIERLHQGEAAGGP